jgi:hypothetical protein
MKWTREDVGAYGNPHKAISIGRDFGSIELLHKTELWIAFLKTSFPVTAESLQRSNSSQQSNGLKTVILVNIFQLKRNNKTAQKVGYNKVVAGIKQHWK